MSLVDTIDELMIDAVKTRGIAWTQEPLWLTWSLDRFGRSSTLFLFRDAAHLILSGVVSQIPNILYPYHRALASHSTHIANLRPHGLPFDRARIIINEWAAQEWVTEDGWDASWEELCEVEVGGWSNF